MSTKKTRFIDMPGVDMTGGRDAADLVAEARHGFDVPEPMVSLSRARLAEMLGHAFVAGGEWNRFAQWTPEHFAELADKTDKPCSDRSPAIQVAAEILRREGI